MNSHEDRSPEAETTDGDPTGAEGASETVRTPVHRRSIEFEAYDEGDSLSVTGRLRDERPWAAGSDRVEHVHDIRLAVSVRKEDQTITAATATMVRFPHAECPIIE